VAPHTKNRRNGIERKIDRLMFVVSPTYRFFLGSLLIMMIGMGVVGWWIAWQLERGVVLRTSEAASLYVDSFLSSPLQELSANPELSAVSVAEIRALLSETALGRHLIALKIWSADGTILYSDNADLIGMKFAVSEELANGWQGITTGNVSNLDDPENARESQIAKRLLDIYIPVRDLESGQVIAVAEFYQRSDSLEEEIRRAQTTGWLVLVGGYCTDVCSIGGFCKPAQPHNHTPA
jgi:hypothetical protein